MTDAVDFLVFADDWGRHPSSCQHLFRYLLPAHRVTWVNTIGMRKPRLNLATLQRVGEKLKSWLRSSDVDETSTLPDSLRVLNPRMWPYFAHAWDRGLNRRWLGGQLKRALGDRGPQTVAVTTLPITADLMGELPVRRWVYYCVDDFSVWPGLDAPTLRSMERDVIAKADRIVAVSEPLQQAIRAQGKSSNLLTHGVDVEHWTQPSSLELPAEIRALPRPWIVFWGVIDRRMNAAWITRLAEQLDSGTILLVGPQEDPDPVLRTTPRVILHEPLPYASLPRLGQEAAVLIMPYADLPVTRAMQPLKLKEYLATGRPVVVSDLPSTRAWRDAADVAVTGDEFCAAALRGARGDVEPGRADRNRELLAKEDWRSKAQEFASFLLEGL